MSERSRGLRTALVHASADAQGPGLAPPLDRSTTFRLDEAADEALATRTGIEHIDTYGRFGCTTTRLAGSMVARIEEAPAGLVLSSGMAAVHAALQALVPGQGRVVAAHVLYGGTESVFERDLMARGVEIDRFDPADPGDLARALEAPADLVWCEAISNPLMQASAVGDLAPLCHEHGALLVVDGTFAAGMAMKPFARGADLVVHSATKFLNGHSDVTAGAVAGRASLVEEVYGCMVRVGSNLDPGAAWLLSRGLRTLPLRWRAMVEGTGALTAWLRARSEVEAVYALDAPEGAVTPEASDLLTGGAMVSFELADAAAAARFVRGLKVAAHATSLGGVETLVSVPARSSHATLPPEARRTLGIADGLVRVSVGVEDPEDLMADFAKALEATS